LCFGKELVLKTQNSEPKTAFSPCGEKSGEPGRIRTFDHLIKSQVLYRAELLARKAVISIKI
jgi:hypothetical protein